MRRLGLCCAVLLLATSASQAQDPDQRRLLGQVERTSDELARIRGVGSRPLTVVIRSADQVRARVVADLARRALPLQAARRRTRALRRLALIPTGFELRSARRELIAGKATAFYEPTTRILYVALRRDAPPKAGTRELDGPYTLVHEVARALQHQDLPAERWNEVLQGNSDRQLAYRALIAGETQLMATLYAMGRLGAKRVDMRQVNQLDRMMAMLGPAGAHLAKLPPWLLERAWFPHTRGSELVQAIRRRDGWKGVRAAFSRPPSSTEQVLHPEKYLGERDEPRTIRFPDSLGRDLGGRDRRLHDDVLGELGVSILLRSLGVAREDAQRAAAGWDGDRWVVWDTPDKRTVLVWLSTWDSTREAEELVSTCAGLLAKRGAHLERRGSEVLLIEGASAAERERLVTLAFRAVTVEERWTPLPGLLLRPPIKKAPLEPKPRDPATARRLVDPRDRRPAQVKLYRWDEAGASFVVPPGFSASPDPLQARIGALGIRSAHFEGPNGARLRLLAFPAPYNTALQQLDAAIRQGAQGVVLHERRDVTLQGEKAVRVVFSALVPGETVKSRNTTYLMSRGQKSFGVGISLPEQGEPSSPKALESLLSTLWLDESGQGLLIPLTRTVRHGQSEFVIAAVLRGEGSVLGDDVVHHQVDHLGARVQVLVQATTDSDLSAFGSRLVTRLGPDTRIVAAGLVTRRGRLVHEIELVRAGRRSRRVTLFQGGLRWTVSCSVASARFDAYRARFGQVLATFEARPLSPPPKPRKRTY